MEKILGAIVGDVVGSKFEFNNFRSKNFKIPSSKEDKKQGYDFTDDTIMTVAVCDILIHNKDVVKTFQEYGLKYPSSYGCSFSQWLRNKNPLPYNSFGNGSAMRISPVGWFANSEEDVRKLSKKITQVTHNHPEGLKGAEVTAMCVYYARKGKSKDFIKKYVEQYYNLDFDYEVLKKNYYFNETCQNTVPQAIYCFLISNNFEDCVRTSVSIGGDTDTLAAISCSIASAYYSKLNDETVSKISLNIYDNFLPKEFKSILKEFFEKVVD